MFSFLKRFAFGFLYIVTLPFMLLVLALSTLYCTLSFIYEFFLGIISFFKGGKFFAPLKEDLEAEAIMQGDPTVVTPDISSVYPEQTQEEKPDLKRGPSRPKSRSDDYYRYEDFEVQDEDEL